MFPFPSGLSLWSTSFAPRHYQTPKVWPSAQGTQWDGLPKGIWYQHAKDITTVFLLTTGCKKYIKTFLFDIFLTVSTPFDVFWCVWLLHSSAKKTPAVLVPGCLSGCTEPMLSFQPFLQDLRSHPGWKEIAMWIYSNPPDAIVVANDDCNLGFLGLESNFPSFDPFGGNDFCQAKLHWKNPLDQPPSISRREYPLTKSAHAPAARISPRIDSGLKVCFPWVSGNSYVKSVDLRDPNLIKDDHRVLTHQRINLTSAIWEQENFVMNPNCLQTLHPWNPFEQWL